MYKMKAYSHLFIIVGIILILFGVLLRYTNLLQYFGKLPGDIVIKKENFTFIFPLTTMIILSIIINIIIRIIRK